MRQQSVPGAIRLCEPHPLPTYPTSELKLASQNLRAVYDRNGAKMIDKEGGIGMEDAAGFFANVFGGERFRDYVSRPPPSPAHAALTGGPQIGEISLMKEMTSVATTMMSEEEKAEMEREMNDGRPAASPSVSAPPSGATLASPLAEAQTVATSASAPHLEHRHAAGVARRGRPTQGEGQEEEAHA